MITFTTHSALELQRLGKLFGNLAQGGEVVILMGELGAGKTTFAQGVAAGLGVTEHVTSPTFTLINAYPGRLTLVHCDFYRLQTVQEAVDIGFLDYLRAENVVLVEWGEAFSELMPSDLLRINIAHGGEGRQLKVDTSSGLSQGLVEKWVSLWQS